MHFRSVLLRFNLNYLLITFGGSLFFCTRDYENWNHFIPIQIGAKFVKVSQLMYACLRDKPMIKWFIKGFLNANYKYILFELSIESVGKMLSALHDFNHKNIYFVFRMKWYHKKIIIGSFQRDVSYGSWTVVNGMHLEL